LPAFSTAGVRLIKSTGALAPYSNYCLFAVTKCISPDPVLFAAHYSSKILRLLRLNSGNKVYDSDEKPKLYFTFPNLNYSGYLDRRLRLLEF
jgi:hypothetical protein